MELIMSNPTERDLIRMRQDVENDWITIVGAERRDAANTARIETLAGLVQRQLLTVDEAAKEANMTVKEFTQ